MIFNITTSDVFPGTTPYYISHMWSSPFSMSINITVMSVCVVCWRTQARRMTTSGTLQASRYRYTWPCLSLPPFSSPLAMTSSRCISRHFRSTFAVTRTTCRFVLVTGKLFRRIKNRQRRPMSTFNNFFFYSLQNVNLVYAGPL